MIQLTGVELAHPQGRGADTSLALDGITLALAQGEFRWLLGAAGSGKSSLLGVLDTTIRASAGRVVLLGSDVARLGAGARAALRRRIGSVRTEPGLLAHLTAFENVALPLRIAGERASAVRVDVTEMLQWVGLGHRMHVAAGSLSRGEALLCALARAVVPRPGLLVADEPFAGFSGAETERMFALVREVSRLGTTVVIATRDDRLPARFPAPVLHLDRGRIVAAPLAATAAALVPA